MNGERRVLVLYWHPDPAAIRLAIRDHLCALELARTCRVIYHNAVDPAPPWLRGARFDAIVLHTTFLCMRWSNAFYTWKWDFRWVGESRALKIALPQDEYDHYEALDEWLWEWGVDWVFSNFGDAHRRLLYPRLHDRARFKTVLTGYIDAHTARRLSPLLLPASRRPLDVVYRATRLPYWFGEHGQLKHRIGEAVQGHARRLGLRTDISTDPADVITGPGWMDFLASGRAVIGCESGSSAVDARGEIQAAVLHWLDADPDLTFEEVSARLPPGWDGTRLAAVGPRHLEAVITRTAQVLVEGDYGGILVPERHYFPVRADLGNLEEALRRVRDDAEVDRVTEQAYREVYLEGDWTYGRLARELDEVIRPAARRSTAITGAIMARTGARRREELIPDRVGLRSTLRQLLRHVRRNWSEDRVTLRYVRRHPPLRALLLAYLRQPDVRAIASAGSLLDDLLRLGVVMRAQWGMQTAGTLFRVSARYDAARARLDLRSVGDGCPVARLTGAEESAIRRGQLNLVIWDHGQIGDRAFHALDRRRWADILIDPDGHRFQALAALAAVEPRLVGTVVCDALSGGALVPGVSRRQRPLSGLARARRDPRGALGNLIAWARLLAIDPVSRRLVRDYVASPEARQRADPESLLDDLLRLRLLRGACRERAVMPLLREDEAVLELRTCAGGGAGGRISDVVDGHRVDRVVWDHSAAGGYVLCPVLGSKRVTVLLGPDGRYEFGPLHRLSPDGAGWLDLLNG